MVQKQKSLVSIDTPHYGYFRALYMAFYSMRLYVDVGKRWKGYGILYTLLIASLFTIPLTFRLVFIFTDYFDNQLMAPLKKMPELYIQNGEVVFDKPMPWMIKNDKGEVAIIIDTTGQILELDEKWPSASLLITKREFHFKPLTFDTGFPALEQSYAEKVYIESLPSKDTEVLDLANWVQQGGWGLLKHFIQFLFYPLTVSVFFFLLLTLLPAIALMGQVFGQIFFSFKPNFKQACRLVAVSATAPLLIFMLLLTFRWNKPGMGLVVLAILIVYFCLGLIALKNDSKRIVRT